MSTQKTILEKIAGKYLIIKERKNVGITTNSRCNHCRDDGCNCPYHQYIQATTGQGFSRTRSQTSRQTLDCRALKFAWLDIDGAISFIYKGKGKVMPVKTKGVKERSYIKK